MAHNLSLRFCFEYFKGTAVIQVPSVDHLNLTKTLWAVTLAKMYKIYQGMVV